MSGNRDEIEYLADGKIGCLMYLSLGRDAQDALRLSTTTQKYGYRCVHHYKPFPNAFDYMKSELAFFRYCYFRIDRMI